MVEVHLFEVEGLGLRVGGVAFWCEGLGFRVLGVGSHRGRYERRERQDCGGVDDLLEDRCEPEQRARAHLHAFDVIVCRFHYCVFSVLILCLFDRSFLISWLIFDFMVLISPFIVNFLLHPDYFHSIFLLREGDLALDAHGAIHQLGDLLRDGEAKPRAPVRPRRRRVFIEEIDGY